MKKFKLWNVVCGWVVFAIAAATYLLTMEPTASFWDCGEFIVSANKLDVGHPPGAPFFMLLGRFFSLFASDPSHVAMCVNALSALASALTILFLFWTITALGRKLVQPDTISKGIALLGAGAVGALAYTFSDTFWFSAVEGEVYALSSLFTAVVFWLILKWDEHADEEGSDKWLILIAYLMGLSIGVHLLNLLTIPAIVLVYYFRRHDFSWTGVCGAFGVSVAILAAILYGIIPGVPTIAGWFELLFINTLGFPFNTGLVIYLLLMAAALVWAIWETYKAINDKNTINTRTIISFVTAMTFAGVPFIKESVKFGILLIVATLILLFVMKKVVSARWLNTITMMVTVIIIGYASYVAIVIRSAAETPMDQNSPDNVFSLKYYLNREQYGDNPLFYGPTFIAPIPKEQINGRVVEGEPDFSNPVMPIKRDKNANPIEIKGQAQYAKAPREEGKPDRYEITGHKMEYEYESKHKMLFPRMYSGQSHHAEAYKEWADIKGKRVSYTDYGYNRKNEFESFTAKGVMPTFAENLRFFFRYQVNFMYWRYFMWNFAGRQNDLQSYGELHKGNWISGIPFIDNARLGDQSKLPTELRENKGHNVYYMLPLLLGIIGIMWQFGKRNNANKNKEGYRSFSITFLLFFLTGLAIVVYLNQTPYQPRERDYAYAGSFYAFCIWIGLGVMAIIDLINQFSKNKEKVRIIIAAVVVVVTMLVPVQMASQNWDDHDRSNRYAARDFGANYLNSCDENAIIFCNGDNDTFPLWYNIEVEGERDDVRACNLSYLQTDWYIDQMKRPYYNSPGLPISWEYKDYMPGKNEIVRTISQGSPMEVKDAFRILHSNDATYKYNGEVYLPTDQLYVLSPDNKKVLLKKSNYFTRSEMMVMEMLSTNNWKRPMYFATTIGGSYHLGLDPYLELTGMAYRITPERSLDGRPRVNTEVMYDNMLHKFKYGNLNQPGIYIDENTMRMCRTHRMMFIQLAEALYNEEQQEKCLEVLDFAESVLPGYNVPHDESSLYIASLYYELGVHKKGDAIMSVVANNSIEYIEWGIALNKEHRKTANETIERHFSILGTLIKYLKEYDREDLLAQYSPEKYASLANKYFEDK